MLATKERSGTPSHPPNHQHCTNTQEGIRCGTIKQGASNSTGPRRAGKRRGRMSQQEELSARRAPRLANYTTRRPPRGCVFAQAVVVVVVPREAPATRTTTRQQPHHQQVRTPPAEQRHAAPAGRRRGEHVGASEEEDDACTAAISGPGRRPAGVGEMVVRGAE
jgi:hypothetical protein